MDFLDARRALGRHADMHMTTAVPEPESYVMMLLGLGLLGFMVRRKTAA